MKASSVDRPRRVELAFAALLALVFGAAPTVGDVGSCGKTASALDLAAFAHARKTIDCQRCTACGIDSKTCQDACNPGAPGDVSWPPTCHPLYHDGEVCIDALQAASCGDYASFVSDTAPTLPSECDFCHDVPDGGTGVGDL